MALPSGADVELGGVAYKLDRSYETLTGRRAYTHGGRPISVGGQIFGRSGAEITDNRLVWYVTDFEGEGQVVLDPQDPDSAKRFYRSEGLNFRIPGQGSLNKSVLTEIPDNIAGAASTQQGAADFADVTGTSTVVATDDRRLNALNDVVGSTAVTPGANNVQVDFYLYHETWADYATTIEGNDLGIM